LKIRYNNPRTTNIINIIITTFSAVLLFPSISVNASFFSDSLLAVILYSLVLPSSAVTVIVTVLLPFLNFSFPVISTLALLSSGIAFISRDVTSLLTVILYSLVSLLNVIS